MCTHERTKEFTESIVTTQEVLTEDLNFSSSGRSACAARLWKVGRQIYATQRYVSFRREVVLFMLLFDMFRARTDQGYSLKACIPMQVSAGRDDSMFSPATDV